MSLVHRFRPIATQDSETFTILYDIEHNESKAVNDCANEIHDNLFIGTANLEGIKKFEKIYDVKGKASDSLEVRRDIIHNIMAYRPPFTRLRLENLLTNIFGEGNFEYDLDIPNFSVTVSVPPTNVSMFQSYLTQVRNIVPANLNLVFSTPYTYIFLCFLIYGSDPVYTQVGEGNGNYIYVSKERGYVFVGDGKGDYVISDESEYSDDKLCYYTYKELSKYSTSMFTNTIYPAEKSEGEIVELEGAGSAYISEM